MTSGLLSVKSWLMKSNNLFEKWCMTKGSKVLAARALKLSPATVTLIIQGKRRLQPRHAVMIENDSRGVFKREDLISWK